ncbi:hypothetical protein L3X38_024179 [Prunus dulcis]|uniref:Uncharacterized protein n=1 Tax=Prunus dulcis TaxID=3755 RepID=A0AAD4W049_PRUDU|nr:hypothetical protein L3X38_024179 [Prunus dulcis]
MDLSYNRFSGLLPIKHFEHLTAMINLQEHELKYMGGGYYQDTVVVAIKCNVIEMAKIMTFSTTIDFSNNTFREEIPNAISKLKLLKGLQFSHNELTGTIPPSFGDMCNLECGNTGLCGLPLSKICNAHQSPPSSFQQEDDLEHGNGFDWNVVLMGYVSGGGRKQRRRTVEIT